MAINPPAWPDTVISTVSSLPVFTGLQYWFLGSQLESQILNLIGQLSKVVQTIQAYTDHGNQLHYSCHA